MAKKKNTSNLAVPSCTEQPPTRICVTKAQAGDVYVGQKISITVEGEVQGIRKDYYDGTKYEIEIKDSEVTDISGNKADEEYEGMMGKKKK